MASCNSLKQRAVSVACIIISSGTTPWGPFKRFVGHGALGLGIAWGLGLSPFG